MRLAQLVGKLLDVSRARLGRLNVQSERCDLVAVVRAALEQCRDDLARANIAVSLTAPEPVVAPLDRARIVQVVGNLIGNAIKHAPGAPLQISVERRGDSARIAVRDHGPGVAEAQRVHLFDLFENGESSRDLGGLGLGLYISRQILEAHGGRLRLENVPGPGACFVAELPLNP